MIGQDVLALLDAEIERMAGKGRIASISMDRETRRELTQAVVSSVPGLDMFGGQIDGYRGIPIKVGETSRSGLRRVNYTTSLQVEAV